MSYWNFLLKHLGSKLVLSTAVLGWVAVCATQPAVAHTEKVLYSFGSYSGDALWPYAGSLVMDTEGNFYGTTYAGGAYDYGTVFKLTPSGTETVLYSFGSPTGDGQHPCAGLVMNKKGILYGTTYWGGANGYGTVFKLTPAGVETVLYSFKGYPDGGKPMAGLIMDKNKNLYGTTTSGGANGDGAVFKVTPSGTETVLYSFEAIPDGNTPYGGLIMDSTGTLYGTTFYGGTYNDGTVFKLTPSGTETVLHSFSFLIGSGDGEYPLDGLIMDKNGNLYGTTEQGGAHGDGTVFELTAAGVESLLYSFGSQPGDGSNAYPYAGVIMDKKGNLYGTTIFGGADNDGMVFKVYNKGGTWKETILHTFVGEPGDGERPFGGLIRDKMGNLYGTTYYGGAYNDGTVFEVTP
jgi:uncharacterized repeat protein (TIGR03803 family)